MPSWNWFGPACVLILVLGLTSPADLRVRADEPAVLPKEVPANVADLKAIQKQVKQVLDKVLPCTVGVRIGAGSGSGVIISKDGYVLTAGHVSGQPDREAILILPDGKRVKGKTLGVNRNIDSGLIKITDPGDWPFVEMGKSAELKPGQWCIATGHPGGFQAGRSPVVRLGRVVHRDDSTITTDCALVGGDSGGPLFDLHGKVIGIHSRIGGSIAANMHVPVDTYRDTWDRLVKGEAWGGRPTVVLGVQGEPSARECKITQVAPNSPAARAGLKANDIIVTFDGQKVGRYDDLVAQLQKKKPGDEVVIDFRRGSAALSVLVVLSKR